MIKAAITGNIGSGKTTVSHIFKVMGVPVFNADIEARLLYLRDDVKQLLSRHFGDAIFDTSFAIDKKKLAVIIFNDRKKLQTINNIIHPLVFEKYKEWLDLHQEKFYTLHESAILFENKLESRYDLIINVTAPPEIRLSRIIQRDGVEREKIEVRMAHQWSEEEKNKRADFIIINDGHQLLIPQVIEMDKKIRNKLWKE